MLQLHDNNAYFGQPSCSSWNNRKRNHLAELLTPYFGNTIIRPLYKKGKTWICEIVETSQEAEFNENEFNFI